MQNYDFAFENAQEKASGDYTRWNPPIGKHIVEIVKIEMGQWPSGDDYMRITARMMAPEFQSKVFEDNQNIDKGDPERSFGFIKKALRALEVYKDGMTWQQTQMAFHGAVGKRAEIAVVAGKKPEYPNIYFNKIVRLNASPSPAQQLMGQMNQGPAKDMPYATEIDDVPFDVPSADEMDQF